MLLKIIQCTGQPPPTENYSAQKVRSAEVESPALGRFFQNTKQVTVLFFYPYLFSDLLKIPW